MTSVNKHDEAKTSIPANHAHAPEALVTEGRFNLGMYRQPFGHVNPLDAQIGPVPLPRFLKNLLLREWEHYALVSPRWFVSLAMFNSKRLGLAHVVAYDRERKSKILYERLPFPASVQIPADLWDSVARVNLSTLRIEAQHDLNHGRHRIEFACEGAATMPKVQGTFVCYEDLNTMEPLVVCLPLGKRGAMYSHKGIFPLEGELRVGSETFAFSRTDSFALPDIHKGFYPYVTKWHWATGGGHDDAGRLIGFNLTNNQVKDQKTYNENCLWIDGKAYLLPPVRFSMDSESLDRPWRVQDEEGRIDVTFQPETMREINRNFLILRSRYRGPYGAFSGRIVDTEGVATSVGHCFGLAEDFYLRA